MQTESQVEEQSAIGRWSYDENMTLDTYTAGRYSIWKGYIQYLNLTGNDFSKANWAVLTQTAVRHRCRIVLVMRILRTIPIIVADAEKHVIQMNSVVGEHVKNQRVRIAVCRIVHA